MLSIVLSCVDLRLANNIPSFFHPNTISAKSRFLEVPINESRWHPHKPVCGSELGGQDCTAVAVISADIGVCDYSCLETLRIFPREKQGSGKGIRDVAGWADAM